MQQRSQQRPVTGAAWRRGRQLSRTGDTIWRRGDIIGRDAVREGAVSAVELAT